MKNNQKKEVSSIQMMGRIFCKDIKGLTRNILAMVVAGGLCVLPCLYAWFNIYSNWDPYGSTSNVPIAVFSEDAGYTTTDGKYENLGESVIDSLHDNNKLGWTFCESKEEAIEGVRSGEYYAAIVMGSDFSERMYNFVDCGLQHPTVTYYQNEKKNAVAIKITDTGKSTLQSTINTEFLNTMIKTIFEALQKNATGEDVLNVLAEKINTLNTNIEDYITLVEAMKSANQALAGSMGKMASLVPQMSNAIDNAAANSGKITQGLNTDVDKVEGTVNQVYQDTLNSLNTINNSLMQLLKDVEDPEKRAADINAIKAECDKLAQSGDAQTKLTAQKISSACTAMLAISNGLNISTASTQELVNQAYQASTALATEYQKLINEELAKAEQGASQAITDIADTLSNVSGNLDGVGYIFSNLKNGILGMNDTLDGSNDMLNAALAKTGALLNKLDETGNTAMYKRIMAILSTDPELYADFLSAPVEVTIVHVWEVENYGSGVTPFYTTLALWVGGILLVSIFKVHAEAEGPFKGAKPHQLFLGRFILFWLLGQIQAALTVLGNLYLLKVQCLHPGRFFLAASFTSFVFVLFIYTLTNAWGDVGKALVVVIVVMQIAGSSGTYPIEILPTFYQKLHVYFPFPYAINAMRECIAGMYENTYWIRLLQLSVFAVVSLLLGLLVRIPFIKINEFVEERMEDTKMM